jgi:transcriptional regulator with XRE-family HTH domain
MTGKKRQGSKARTQVQDDRSYRTAQAALMELRLAELSIQSRRIAGESGLSRRVIAERMGLTSPSTVQRILGPASFYNVTVETLWRFAIACGYELGLEFRTTQRPRAIGPELPGSGVLRETNNVIDLAEWKRRSASASAMADAWDEASGGETDHPAKCGGV